MTNITGDQIRDLTVPLARSLWNFFFFLYTNMLHPSLTSFQNKSLRQEAVVLVTLSSTETSRINTKQKFPVADLNLPPESCVTKWSFQRVWKTWAFTRQRGSNEKPHFKMHHGKCRIPCFRRMKVSISDSAALNSLKGPLCKMKWTLAVWLQIATREIPLTSPSPTVAPTTYDHTLKKT